MLIVVNLYNNPSTYVVEGYVAVGDVTDIAASSGSSFYPDTSP